MSEVAFAQQEHREFTQEAVRKYGPEKQGVYGLFREDTCVFVGKATSVINCTAISPKIMFASMSRGHRIGFVRLPRTRMLDGKSFFLL